MKSFISKVGYSLMGTTKIKYTHLFINNTFVPSVQSQWLRVFNPSTEEQICQVSEATAEDGKLAFKAAEQCYQKVWSKTPADKRVELLYKLADKVENNAQYIIDLESINTGRPRYLSENDVSDSIKFIRFFAGCADKLYGKTYSGLPTHFSYTLREPYGVVAVISPWNFPFMMTLWKLIPAIASGNCVIAKPSEVTPLTSLYFAQLFKEVGFPDGVVSMLPGKGDIIGKFLSKHKKISKISFTGSTTVGRMILKASAESNLKPVSLELGGKNPVIICDDANLQKAVNELSVAAFYNSGQNCMCPSRILVQKGIYDKFINKFSKKVSEIRVGNYSDEQAQMGPVINETQCRKIQNYFEIAQQENLSLVLGGSRMGCRGFFIHPTIYKNVKDSSQLAKEELFGPISVILEPFSTIEEAIKRSNNTKYGLCGAIFSQNIHTIQKCVSELQAGTIFVNNYSGYTPSLPFNGFKQSGFGSDNGMEALQNYTRVKTVYQLIE